MKFKPYIGVLGIAVAAVLATPACGSASGASGHPEADGSVQDASAITANTAAWTVLIFRGAEQIKASDRKGHDAFVPSNFVVKKGEATTVTFVNEDDGPHTLTSPELGVNIEILPGRLNADKSVTPVNTSATVTATKTGAFRWYCATPCDAAQDGWAMTEGWDGVDQSGFMAGYIVVV